MTIMKGPLVSIRLMTFNHGQYISQAIEGVLIQKTNFDYEIVVGDDFSTDDTLAIVEKYAELYPSKIRILVRQKGDAYDIERQQKGRLFNFIDILNNCTGKYIALLDGDDYWTDPLKLQKQVDFLEANEEYTICGTYCDVLRPTGLEKRVNLQFETFDHYDIISNNQIPSLTMCFHRDLIKQTDFSGYPIGDIVILLEVTKNGGLGAKLSFNSGVYRYHGRGANSGNSRSTNTVSQYFVKCLYLSRNKDHKFAKVFRKYLIENILKEVKLLLKFNFKLFELRIIKVSLKYFFKTLRNKCSQTLNK
tara:strand:+ start:737 stop:1651 length:915 start_codon:yes stop_codon:yes gene_type:complete